MGCLVYAPTLFSSFQATPSFCFNKASKGATADSLLFCPKQWDGDRSCQSVVEAACPAPKAHTLPFKSPVSNWILPSGLSVGWNQAGK